MKRILVIKTSSLGDIVQAFPILEYLKNRYPQALIDWVVEQGFADLLRAHPLVDRVLKINTKAWRKGILKKETWGAVRSFCTLLRSGTYDLAVDLQGNIKSGMIMGFAKAASKIGFGYRTVSEKPNLLFTRKRYNPPKGRSIREDYLFLLQSCLNDFSESSLPHPLLRIDQDQEKKLSGILKAPELEKGEKVLVSTGSAWKNKQVSFQAMQQFLSLLAENHLVSFLFIWGSMREKEEAEKLQAGFPGNSILVEKLSLPVLQNLMAKLDLVIAMDSLPLHLAGMAGISTFSVFGPSSALKYRPEGRRHIALQGVCPYGKSFEKRCPILRTCKTGACIKQLDGEALFAEFCRQRSVNVHLPPSLSFLSGCKIT